MTVKHFHVSTHLPNQKEKQNFRNIRKMYSKVALVFGLSFIDSPMSLILTTGYTI